MKRVPVNTRVPDSLPVRVPGSENTRKSDPYTIAILNNLSLKSPLYIYTIVMFQTVLVNLRGHFESKPLNFKDSF